MYAQDQFNRLKENFIAYGDEAEQWGSHIAQLHQ